MPGAIVSDGRIFVATGNHNQGGAGFPTKTGYIMAFGIPLSVQLSIAAVRPGGNWGVRTYGVISGGMPGYTCEGTWGDGTSSAGCNNPGSPAYHFYTLPPPSSYRGNLTVLDYQGVKVVIPFSQAVGVGTFGTLRTDSLVMTCGVAVVSGGHPGVGSCVGGLTNDLTAAGYSVVSGGLAPYTYSWDFGDHSVALTTQNANHTYSTGGLYLVQITGTDSSSNHAIAAVWVNAPG